MKISQISERLKEPKDDKGGGLLTLLGIGSIVLVTALSIAGAATFGTIITHGNLAIKQASDSADSGISEALFKLSNGTCVDASSDTTLNYTYQVYHSQALIAPTAVDAPGIVAGCPTGSDKWVLIQAEGEGKNDKKKKSVATFKWVGDNAKVIPQVITGQNVNLTSAVTIDSASGLKARPTLYSKNGGVSCVNSSGSLNKNVNISVDQPTSPVNCSITGDIRAAPDADLNSAEIMGDACSTGFLANASNVAGETLESAATCGPTGSMYGYKPNYLSNTVNLSGAACASIAKFKETVETAYAKPTIINATLCGADLNGVLSSLDSKNFNIGTNELTVIVDENTSIRNLTVNTTDGPSSLNFVIPSGDSNSTQSSCLIPAALILDNVKYKEGVNGIFYSPCSTILKDSDISGQVYGGQSVTIENTSIHYYPVELINADSIFGDGSFQKHLVRVF